MNRRLLIALSVLALCLGAGCLTTFDTPGDDSDARTAIEDGSDVEAALQADGRDVDAIRGATVTSKTGLDGERETITTSYAFAPERGSRITREYDPGAQTYRTQRVDEKQWVSNPDTTWHYVPQLEVVKEGAEFERPTAVRLRSWLREATLSYQETTNVSGREAHHVVVESFGASSLPEIYEHREVHVWVDDHHLYPIKWQFVDESGQVTQSVERTDLQLGADIDTDQFTFDPPANATVLGSSVDSDGEDSAIHQTFDDVAAARSESFYEVAVPETVPRGYERTGVTVLDATFSVFHATTLQYEHQEHEQSYEWNVQVETRVTRPSIPEEAEQESFDDRQAYSYQKEHGTVVIAWTCDRLWYRAVGYRSVEDLRPFVEATACH